MNPATAFSNAANGDLPSIATLASGLVCVAVFLWAGWALLSVYLGWARGRVELAIFNRAIVRIMALALVILWIVL